jgi:hypothetical protein
MKKIILFLAAMAAIVVSHAQTAKEEMDLVQAAFGMEKKALVANYIQLEGAQNDVFWALYDEYETVRKDYGKTRIELLAIYANTYQSMTGEIADAWVEDVMNLQESTDKLIRTYYKKIKKEVDPITAAKFYQIENYILTAIRMELQDAMPFINEK